MGLFFKKSSITDNRIENAGRWPVRLTHFYLIDEYEFPATNFPEIFFVREGNFLHETDIGTQAVREGAVVVVNPGHRHTIKKPEEVVLTRVRYLPEWLTLEYDLIANSPNVLSLFFDQSWFRYPRDENLHVFTTRSEGGARVRAELDYLGQLLKDKRQLEPVARVSVLKLMMLLADEHHRFWRGVTEVEFLPEAKHALDQIEGATRRAEAFDASSMPRGGFEKLAIERAFEEITGMTMMDYAHRRRVFYAACHLLFSEDEPRKISKALGFGSMSEFNREFESIFDIPPSVYREKFGPVKAVAEALPDKEGA
ncbi:MAG: helix-turn-helix domain-containing protein [Verrucomicrobiales bacterium]|nr:helix-turn-helix domain-containing protein [Verrucomicrobiales bacterium]